MYSAIKENFSLFFSHISLLFLRFEFKKKLIVTVAVKFIDDTGLPEQGSTGGQPVQNSGADVARLS